jgi:hypothetical protein
MIGLALSAQNDTVRAALKQLWGVEMPKSDHEREDPVVPSGAQIPEYLVERLAPRSRDPVVIFGGHLLQLIGAIAIIFVIFHFLFKYW